MALPLRKDINHHASDGNVGETHAESSREFEMPEELPCTLITWDEVYDQCRQLARQLRDKNVPIDIIVAIARGGYIPGRILSDMLGIDDLAGFKIEHYRGTQKQQEAFVTYPLNADINGRAILLLDDVCDSGDTFAVGVEHIRQRGAVKQLSTAALHLKTVSGFIPDFYVETLSEWRWIIYPWAINEDLSSMIAKLRDTRNVASIRQEIKRRHGVEVSHRQIEDALILLRSAEA
ncbi:MAG: phosphoribosyltransferase [Methylosarcina sp.]